MTERNADICKLYLSGLSLKEAGEKYGLSRERARQIVRSAIEERMKELVKTGVRSETARQLAKEEFRWGHEKHAPRSDRDEFLGIHLNENDKEALRQEAKKRGVSMSSLTSDLIKDMLSSLSTQTEAQ